MEELRIVYEVENEKIDASLKSFLIDLRKRVNDFDFLVIDCYVKKD